MTTACDAQDAVSRNCTIDTENPRFMVDLHHVRSTGDFTDACIGVRLVCDSSDMLSVPDRVSLPNYLIFELSHPFIRRYKFASQDS